MQSPSVKTLKRLYATSGNRCAFPSCYASMIDPETGVVIGETCHIKSRRAGGPRYDPSQKDEERNAFKNLIAMCGAHHKTVDSDAKSYTVERLLEIKRDHEAEISGESSSREEQAAFLDLLDSRIDLILQRAKGEDESAAVSETATPEDILRQLANEQRYKQNRGEWFRSGTAANEVVDSINSMFRHFEDYYLDHQGELHDLGINKNSKDIGFRSLFDGRIISQIKISGR